MFEETNQAGGTQDFEGMELPDNLFGGEIAEGAADGAETTPDTGAPEQAEPEISETEPDKPTGQTVRVRYNGKEQELTLDEAVTLAQKGMNYDHVNGELEALRRDHSVIDSYAKLNGMSREEYIEFLRQNQQEFEKQRLREELAREHEEIPDAVIEELARTRQAEAELNLYRQREQQEEQSKEAQVQAWGVLLKQYPEIKVDELPQSVFDGVKTGLSPVEAYQRHMINDLRMQIERQNHTKDVKQRALGSVAGDGIPPADKDLFLEGLRG